MVFKDGAMGSASLSHLQAPLGEDDITDGKSCLSLLFCNRGLWGGLLGEKVLGVKVSNVEAAGLGIDVSAKLPLLLVGRISH